VDGGVRGVSELGGVTIVEYSLANERANYIFTFVSQLVRLSVT
jgi:hypothetical protein